MGRVVARRRPARLAVGYLVCLGPKWSLALLIASVVFGLSKHGIVVGSIDLRVPDLFYVTLVAWTLCRGHGRPTRLSDRSAIPHALAPRARALALPLLVQGTVDTDPLIAWLRLVATFSLVWLVPYALRTRRDMHFAFGAFGLAATPEVGEAIVDDLVHGRLRTRLEGSSRPEHHGPHRRAGRDPRDPRSGTAATRLRSSMLVVGATGLLMTRSLGATAALVVGLGVYGLTNARNWRTDHGPG